MGSHVPEHNSRTCKESSKGERKGEGGRANGEWRMAKKNQKPERTGGVSQVAYGF
jgi:hypothetical protein